MKQDTVFIYNWYIDNKEEEITKLRAYALDKDNKNICLHVSDFTPYVYLELPTHYEWNERKAQLLGNKLDEELGRYAPLKKCLIMKHKLYGAHITDSGKRKLFPYLFCSFSNRMHITRYLASRLRKSVSVQGIGHVKMKMHEGDADQVLQLISCRDIPSIGWVKFIGDELTGDEKLTYCDREYNVKWKGLYNADKNVVGRPLIMGFDIEVNSVNPAMMPKARNPGDKVFQISCVFTREGKSENELILLTLGRANAEMIGMDAKIFSYDTEADLLVAFTHLVQERNPNVICGYNILGFDIQYMIDRAKLNYCISEFDRLGFHKFNHSQEKKIKWSSSAFKSQEFDYLDAEGRIFVDLLPLIRRDYKFSNYKLGTVSQEILKDDTKDDLSIRKMFKYYKIGTKRKPDGTYSKKSTKAMSLIGRYCLKDSELCTKLMRKMDTWTGLTEFAKTVNTGIFGIYTQGQQIKVYSQVYKYCLQNNIVVEKDGYITKEGERYAGAHVFPPVPGLYDRVLPFDFASLYPTTMIAYNFDYSTLVPDDSNIPNSKCNVIKFSDHFSCSHDPKVIRVNEITAYIDKQKKHLKELRTERDKKCNKLSRDEFVQEIAKKVEELKPYIEERSKVKKTILKKALCGERYYRFYKEIKGVVPTILQNLLDARKNTRVDIKKNKKIIEELSLDLTEENKIKINDLKILNAVLDKRQLAYKVSCNSAYGSYGVQKGYLPFMPGAICTTYMGRTNIEIVANTIQEKYGGSLVYGDSVTGDTPILCKINNKIVYRTIDNLPHFGWNKYRDEKEDADPDNIEVWTENGFTKIKKIIRHKTKKELFRVLTHTGIVDVTEDHGLLDSNANKISPKEIKVGSELLTSDLPIDCEYTFTGIDVNLAFIMGLFYADGSCGCYERTNGQKASTWALNNADRKLLEKCESILNNSKKDTKYELDTLSFKILETMKSSHVLKLVPTGKGIVTFVEIWRELFYDKEKYKKVPDEILWSSKEVRQSFLDGYYAGDGDKDKHGYYRFDNKGKIGASGLYFLASSLGYNVSINIRKDKPSVYRLTCTKSPQRKKENAVKKIEFLGNTEQYVYDLETENHHFSAGIGRLIVHNTDSNYCNFPHVSTAKESWEYGEYVASEITKLFPHPIKLEFEENIMWQFLILSKKRYMYKSCGKDGIIDKKIGKKGVLLARRDNAVWVRNLYEEVINKVFDKINRDDVIYFILQEFNRLFSNSLDYKNFVVTKAVGDTGGFSEKTKESQYVIPFKDEKGKIKGKIGSYTVPLLSEDPKERESQMKKKNALTPKEFYEKCLPAQVVLAEKIKRRGGRVENGARLEYLIVESSDGHKGKQYEKIEDFDYFKLHSNIIKVDYFYYLEVLINPMDEVLNVVYGKHDPAYPYQFAKDFTQQQFDFRYKIREKVMNELKSLFRPKLWFVV